MKLITVLLVYLLAVTCLRTQALNLVKKWELELAPEGTPLGMAKLLAVGKDYSLLVSVDGGIGTLWISSSGEILTILTKRVSAVYTITSSNLVVYFGRYDNLTTEGESVGVFRQIEGLVASKEFSVSGTTIIGASHSISPFPASTTKQPEPMPVITINGSKLICYILDAPEIFPKPTVTAPILKPTSATTTVTNPSDGLVALESSTNLVGWTVVAHLPPSPKPTPVSVPITDQSALFLRAREE